MDKGLGSRLTFDSLRSSMWLAWLLDNPLLVREIRRRMRNKLLSWSLILYLVALGVVSSFIMLTTYPIDLGTISLREKIQSIGAIGRNIFAGMAVVEALIALLIAPMVSAGLAVQEKEKDTFDFLRVTTLRARTFVLGCLLTTACFLLLAFSCTMPILGITFIFGGVSMAEILSLNYFLFLGAMAICAWGIFVSTAQVRARGMQIASLITLLLLFVFGVRGTVGTFFSPGSFMRLSPDLMIGSGVLAGLVILALSTAATRRLYDPQNRLFNYRQYTVFMMGLIGLLVGRLSWHVIPGGKGATVASAVDASLMAIYVVGWVLVLLAVVLFSAGRFERGDEVWQVRMRWPIFQRIDERIPLYAFYIALWLGTSLIAGDAWGSTPQVANKMMTLLPVLASALALVWVLCRLTSCYTEDRNKAVILVIVIVLILWFGTLALGAMFDEIFKASNGRESSSALAEALYALSPLTAIGRVLDSQKWGGATTMTIVQLSLALLALIPTWTRRARTRIKVAYTWTDENGK
ncbi:MAG: hypothetical protein ABFD69_05445 [Candidatus Sumerlaeia bacterium]